MFQGPPCALPDLCSGPDGRATVHTLGPVLHLGILPREVVEATGLKAPTDHEAC